MFKPDDRWLIGACTLPFPEGKSIYRCTKLDHPLNCDHGEEALEMIGENYYKSQKITFGPKVTFYEEEELKVQSSYFIHDDTKDFIEPGSWIKISAKDDKELKEKIDKLREPVKEKKMPINNMYEVIDKACKDLEFELLHQGVDEQSRDKILNDLIESINRNVKFKLKKD